MAKNKVQEYFDSYPGSKECFETADGMLFHQEGDARLHQTSTLKETEPVKGHYRSSTSSEESSSEDPSTGSGDPSTGSGDPSTSSEGSGRKSTTKKNNK
ncbi:MAG TPA: hypothetical protein PLS07_00620 [Niabella sp.]|nr:hypothetical protein [Niabella sp.]HQW14288.1 hypothetical protein [Niabella sp.]HQX18432.1 hypothetical protein [Niabella sp.]HQX40076.1 hypothetical protein [Niabella sp.]HRB05959.1 hypothetical protein [Niabella sp.]